MVGAIASYGQDCPDRLCLHRVRGREPALGRPLPELRHLEHPGRGGAGTIRPGQGVRPGGRPGPHHRGRRPDRRPPAHRRRGARPRPRRRPGPGSVVLLAGEPGIGKSTLLLGVLAGLAADGPVLYVCAEESREQVRLRAERLGALHPGLLLAAETDLGVVRTLVEQVRPTVVVVDSVQTVADPELAGAPGGVGAGPRGRRPAGARWPRSAPSPPSWSARSPRTAPSPAPRRSSTWSTWSSTSRATSTTPCAWSAAPRTASGPPTRSAASR